MARTTCIARATCERSELQRKYSERYVRWEARSRMVAIAATVRSDADRRDVKTAPSKEAESVVTGAASARLSLDLSNAGHCMAMLTPPRKNRSTGLLRVST